jgi:ankyrin repeat protein
MHASAKGHMATVKALIDAKADVNKQNNAVRLAAVTSVRAVLTNSKCFVRRAGQR